MKDAKNAISSLKTFYKYSYGVGYPDCVEDAIEALEKQIPKEPTYDGDGYSPDGSFVWDEWICPNCKERYEVDFDEAMSRGMMYRDFERHAYEKICNLFRA